MRGGQWQVIRLLRGLRKRGHHNLILARSGGPLLEHCTRESFKCEALGIGSIQWATKMAQVVHAHDAHSHTMAAIWSKRPLIVSRRVAFPVGNGLFSRWKYSKPKLFAAVSQTVARELRRVRIPEKRIRVVYDGVPLLADKWDFKGPVVIPRFDDARKGNLLPVDAARLANAPTLRSSKLEADLEGACILLYLTDSEGLGSAALLAMSAGIPVIASNVGGLREVVKHGETGLLVPNEVQAVAAAIRALRASPEKTRQMSLNARRMVTEKFSEDRMVADTLALYESVLHGR